jgi:hypothetical protein
VALVVVEVGQEIGREIGGRILAGHSGQPTDGV